MVLPCRFDALMRGVRFELLPRLVVLWSLLSCFPDAMRLCSTPPACQHGVNSSNSISAGRKPATEPYEVSLRQI